jgi:hypothetical protein
MQRNREEKRIVNEEVHTGHYSGRTLVYVHSRYFKPSADELMDISMAALTVAIERDYPDVIDLFHGMHKRIAYYGDMSNEFLENNGQDYDEKLDVGDRRNALQKLRAIDKRKNFGVGRYDRLPGKTALNEFAADLAGPVLDTLGLSKAVIAKIAADLGEYWNEKSDFGSRLRDRVRTAICEATDGDSQLLLVTHGTGCIVAYDVLWQLSHDPQYQELFEGRKIDLWITLGTPLGDTSTRRRLFGAKEKGTRRYPSNIVSWHNLAAEDDYVCHDNTVADDFKPMLKQKQVSTIRDYAVYNLAVRYGKSNPHSSVGYLIHPRIAHIVSEWLRQGHAAPAPTSTSQ